MTQIVVASPGQSDVVASGPQFGVPFTLLGPDGTRATFNNPQDNDYVGWLTNVTGLDSPEVRESADDLIGEDGGVHGDFFYGRRPVILEGQIDNQPAPFHYSLVDGVQVPFSANHVRNLRMTALQRATNAMRRDAALRWAPEGGNEQILYLRRQQSLRIAGAFNKTFQVPLVAADPRIYGSALREQAILPGVADVEIDNVGSMDTEPILTITGPATGISVSNLTTGLSLNFTTGLNLTAGQYAVVDMKNKTIMLNGVTNSYSALNFTTSTWFSLVPGPNEILFTASGTTGASALRVTWRDAWV